MATLTGFKKIRNDNPPSGGQANPTFVFDDIDVNPDLSDSDQVEAKIANASKSDNELGSTMRSSEAPKNVANTRNKPQATPSERLIGGADKVKSNHNNTNNNNNFGASLNPNANSAGGNLDCMGTGKLSPSSRKSPLMALFTGRPRESGRRVYTQEDQFEIEWADLSLQIQPKWYQKLNVSNLIANRSPREDVENQTGAMIKGMEKAQAANGPQTAKKILKNVDGRIRSGEVTAVLGPSGAGKTSLLNGLFGKYRSSVNGSIKVEGAPTKKHLTVCTIPQSDSLIGYLSTQESLWFASRLKNCEDDFNHDRNIERVIELLGLQSCRHTRINKLSGGQYKRVSIAQEMLSSPDILVLDEPTSGLDSLTCYTTVKVLRDLVEASKAHNLINPMSIILTIHQPHYEVLDLFHSVYVMAVGGLTMYQGPPNEMARRTEECTRVKLPSESYNPASFMIELASEKYGKEPIAALVRYQREKFMSSSRHAYQFEEPHPIDEIMGNYVAREGAASKGANNVGSWYKGHSTGGDTKKNDSSVILYPLEQDQESEQPQQHSFVHANLNSSQADNSPAGGQSWKKKQTNSPIRDVDPRIMPPRSGKNSDGVFWRHVNIMTKRCFLANIRDPLLFTVRVLSHIFIPLVFALIYGPKTGIPNGCPSYSTQINVIEYATTGLAEIREKQDAIRLQFQNVGLHFMVYYAFGLCMLAFTAISFPLSMHVLIKEIRNGWYSLSTFILGKFVSELPLAIFLPPISVAIIYYLTGQPSSMFQWRYMVQTLILILIIMITEAKGLIFGALCMNSMQTAVFAGCISTVPFILLSGFLIRINEIPYILQGIAKFSYFKHSVEALIITRYGFAMCPCNSSLIPLNGTPRITGVSDNLIGLVDYYIVLPSSDNSTAKNELETTTLASNDAIGNVPGNNRSSNRVQRAIESLPASIPIEDWRPEMALGVSGERETTLLRNRRTAHSDAPPNIPTATTSEAPTTTEIASTTTEPPIKQGVFLEKLAQLLTRTNAFGYEIRSCDDVEPFTIKDMKLKDNMLPSLLAYLVSYIIVLKVLSYYIIDFRIKQKL